MRVVSFSDFHLFATRSRGNQIINQVKELVKGADTLVICGDLFDFRWSNFSSHQEAFQAANQWITSLCAEVQIPVVYILGNHDGLTEFIPTLDTLAHSIDSFSWHEDYLQIGNTLFLHGDIPIYSEGAKLTPRDFVSDEGIKHSFLSFLYGLITQAYLLKLWRKKSNGNHKIPFIAEAISKTEGLDGVKRVVFGHTHNHLKGFEYGGITYFNGGTAIKTFAIEIGDFEIKT